MTEDFLHYLWQNNLFARPLSTIDGEQITVINPGFHNFNAGPDFSNARIRIGDTIWAGNVEIHINSSDWFKHGHQNDDAYSNIALHVVFKNDSKIPIPGIPICELNDAVDYELYKAYETFLLTDKFVPCIHLINKIEESELTLWLERMLIEKLERKADFIQDALTASNNDWEEVLYHTIARSFGFGINSLPFEMLARSIKYKTLARHADNLFQVEALLFGQAGMLTQDLTDPYGQSLFNEYSFLRKKYQLVPMSASLWKFMRLRPINFPSIRISQFAALINNNASLFSKIISLSSIKDIISIFSVNASNYWDNHFMFDRESPGKAKNLGHTATQLIIINAILPFMFVYGSSTGNDKLCSKVLGLFEQIAGEKNSIINNWAIAGLDVTTAARTQALIQLKTSYCDKKNCLKCRVGNLLLKDPDFKSASFNQSA